MFLKYVILIFSIQTLLLSANYYVKIAQSDDKTTILEIQKDFKAMKLPLVGSKISEGYIVYSGPFKSSDEAHNAFAFIHDYYPDAMLMTYKQALEYSLTKEKAYKQSIEKLKEERKAVAKAIKKAAKELNKVNQEINATKEIVLAKSETNTTQNSVIIADKKEDNVSTVTPMKNLDDNITIEDEEIMESEIQREVTDESFDLDDTLFLSLQGGMDYLQSSGSDSSLINLPSKQAYSYTFKGGYIYSDFILAAIYSNVSNSDVKLNNYSVEADYIISSNALFTPYIGLNGGYSSMTYLTPPVENLASSSNGSSAYLVGGQLGFMSQIYENIFFVLEYRFEMMNHKTSITIDQESLNISNSALHTAEMGISLYF